MKKTKFQVPVWVPERAWDAYVEMRNKTRHPMTDYAKKLAISKLADLVREGYTPTAVLEQSIFHSWQGLFPIRKETRNGRPSADDNIRQTIKNSGLN